MRAEFLVRRARIAAIVGGVLVGLGIGGGVAAVIESLGLNQGSSTAPIVIAGLGLGLGIGLLAAAFTEALSRASGRLP
jgi:uncharacterized membrane protein